MQQDIDKTNVCLFPFTLQISHTLILDFDTNLGVRTITKLSSLIKFRSVLPSPSDKRRNT